ncbi:MAG: phosphoenolpyruvate synthase [Nitrososphaeria archaeon]|jgi:pyruvate,water dikinase
MSRKEKFYLDFEELRREDVALVGGKNSSLGEMVNAGIPVPPGFALTSTGYDCFIEASNLAPKIVGLLSGVDTNDLEKLTETSKKIRALIESCEFPKVLEDGLMEHYRALGKKIGINNPEVAVRSSATAEDLPTASFAGQQDTYLFVQGRDALVESVKKCISSLFTPRAISYRVEKGFDHFKVKLSVGVQKMINSKTAGVMFTLNPVTGDRNAIIIEGDWGVGESVVQGHVDPDRWVVEKGSFKILEANISQKNLMTIKGKGIDGFSKEVEVPKNLQNLPCLSDEQVIELGKDADLIEKHYGRPMDIEWALDTDTNKLYIVQARPETVWSSKVTTAEVAKVKASTAKVLIRGLGASPGRSSGKVNIIMDVKDIANFKEGEILVTEMTAPDWVPAMRKAAGIITNGGGMTAHAAIVSRELGVPCVVGTKGATEVLKTGQEVSMDGALGIIYEGIIEEEKPEVKGEAVAATAVIANAVPITGTKVYMNLGDPGKADEYKDLPFDGIGLMRIEFIVADWVGEHPLSLIEQGRSQVFVDKLAEGIAKVAGAVYPRPIVVRMSDFKTNEYAALKGGEKYEPKENNPMIGWRGVSRYISPEYEPGFRLECKAMKKVRDEMGLKNVWLMLPFVRTTWEVEKAVKIMSEEGLKRSKDFKLWLMAEVPSIVVLADEFSKLCDGFSIGSNDLTQLTLGADRDSGILGNLGYFDERDPAVLRSIAHLIKVAHENNVTVSICGQAPSVYPEITKFLVENGIDSVSVNPDTVVTTKKLVASVEQKLILSSLSELKRLLTKE